MTPKDYAHCIVAHPELEPPDMAVMLAQAYLDLDAENEMLRKYNAGMMEQMDSFTKTYLALDARAKALRDAVVSAVYITERERWEALDALKSALKDFDATEKP